jgi:hypothetical protein
MNGLQIVFRQQAGTEFQVVIQIKRSSSFESRTKRSHSWSFCQLSHALHTAELSLGMLRCQSGSPSGPTSMVSVDGCSCNMGGGRGRVMLLMVLLLLMLLLACEEERRHGNNNAWMISNDEW